MKPTSTFTKKLLEQRLATVGLIWISLWIIVAIAGPLLRPDPTPFANDQFLEFSMLSPGAEVERADGSFTYLLGSDRYGRDFLSRLMAGSAISLSVAGVSVLISLVIGLFLGSVAGYKGGRTDAGMVQRTLKIADDQMPKHLDATDGLAVALCHHFQLSSPSMQKGGSGWKAFIKENPDRVSN